MAKIDDGQAATVHSDAISNSERRRHGRRVDRDAPAAVFQVERFDHAGMLNDSRKQSDTARFRIRVYSISRPRLKALDCVLSHGRETPGSNDESMLAAVAGCN